MAEIQIDGLVFEYSKGAIILNGIDISLKGAQLVSIIGPNGVGKSTLIHCIDHILSPTVGTVMVDGADVAEYRPKDLAK